MRGSANGSVAPARGPENRNVARESYLDETQTPGVCVSRKGIGPAFQTQASN